MATRASDPVRSLKIGSKTPRRGVSQSEADKTLSFFFFNVVQSASNQPLQSILQRRLLVILIVGGIDAGSSSSYLLNSSVATNNFLAKRHSSSSSSQSWRCVVLNGKDVIVFQRKLRKSTTSAAVMQKLSVISKGHFTNIAKLVGISISGEHIYLVYEYVQGSDLGLCIRSKIDPNFTVLSTWTSWMQIATDVFSTCFHHQEN